MPYCTITTIISWPRFCLLSDTINKITYTPFRDLVFFHRPGRNYNGFKKPYGRKYGRNQISSMLS